MNKPSSSPSSPVLVPLTILVGRPRPGGPRLARLASALLLASVLCAQAGPGSLWRDDTSRALVADKRAQKVGDILTIVVQESSTASKDNSTQTSKKSSVDAAINTFFYSPTASGLLTKGGQLPALQYAGQQGFEGGGKINNSERITARVAVRVIDVLPNGSMLLEGRRETSFSGERQEVILRGTVRSEDVAANNTVFSYNVADASIQFISKGTVSDNQRKGWLQKVWEKVTPF
ncbi:MAG TPA: flagellar basal body L-ring protein FlgH [Methylomirabilota bacterium]|nr:flagellar basal body L-ring protein FlgH [Methylomirabilota bacterium]